MIASPSWPQASRAREVGSGAMATRAGDRPTVALSIAHGFTARVFLRSTLPVALLAAGARLGAFVPPASLVQLRDQFAATDIAFYPLDSDEGWLDLLANYVRVLVADWRATATYQLREAEKWSCSAWRRRFWPLRRRLVAPPLLRRAWYQLENRLLPDTRHESAFAALAPDVLVTATPGVLPGDRRLIRRARQSGVPSVTYIQGWDNLTSKALIGARPDYLLVWNDEMRAEAMRLHGFPPERIAVTGAPHFDPYFTREGWQDRSHFLRSLGLDPARPIILFATAPRRYFPESGEIIALLLEAQARGELPAACQIVVRLHPQAVHGVDANADELIQRFGRCVTFDVPRSASGIDADYPADGIVHLGQLIEAAAVTLCVFSSFVIDACIFDRPVVNVAFDGQRPKPYLASVRRYADTDHYRQVLRIGAAVSATSPAALIQAIQRYLANPALERSERARLVREICHTTDGRAGQRVADAILAVARGSWPPRLGLTGLIDGGARTSCQD